MAAALTLAELADLRRFCGYPVSGVTLLPEQATGAAILDLAVSVLTPEAAGTLRRVYLGPLTAMETGLFEAAEGLDIKKAAVYERNLGELAERDALFAAWRLRLCGFLGVPPGASVAQSPGLAAGETAYVPAIYTV